jgi:hypothetical protein
MGQRAAGDGSDDGDDGFIPTCGAAQPMDGELWVHIRLTCALPVERLAPVVGAREMEPRRLRPSWPDHDPAPGAGGRDSSVADGPSSVEPSPHRITIWKGLSVALCRTSDKDRLLSTTLKAGSITQP